MTSLQRLPLHARSVVGLLSLFLIPAQAGVGTLRCYRTQSEGRGSMRKLSAVATFCVLTVAAPARAESVSLYCVCTRSTGAGTCSGGNLIVNVDYAASRVTWGAPQTEGTNLGSYSAEITDRIIAWEKPDSLGRPFQLTINRTNGEMVYKINRPPPYSWIGTYSCSARAPAAKAKF